MIRIAAWGLTTALSAGVVASVLAGEPLPRVVGDSRKTAANSSSATFGDIPARAPVILGPMEPHVLAQALKLEQEAYQRRLDVCLKLRRIAVEQNNDTLLRQADDLEREATVVYHLRTAKLGVKTSLREPLETLDQKLGSGAAETPLTVAPPEPNSAKATAKAPTFRVVNP